MQVRFDEQSIHAILSSLPRVEECAILTRTDMDGNPEIIVWVVPSGSFDPARLKAEADRVLPQGWPPVSFVGVSSLPLSADGSVDFERLANMPVIDADLAARAEAALRRQCGVSEVIAAVVAATPVTPMISVSDLMPRPHLRRSTEGSSGLLPPVRHTRGGRLSVLAGPPIRSTLPDSLWEMLERAAITQTSHGVTYVGDDGSEVKQSYPAILEDAERILGGLRAHGVRAGDAVVLQLTAKQDVIAAFWACQLGGFVTVPLAVPPAFNELHAAAAKFHSCWTALNKPLVITSTVLKPALHGLNRFTDFGGLRTAVIEELRRSFPDRNRHAGNPGDVALILFTSGSTGKPKGVVLTHQNLLKRSAAVAEQQGFSSRDVSLNWFPLDHVGGIAMCHLAHTWTAAEHLEVPADWILQDPLRWLDLIDKHRVTFTWAPNFAFALINEQQERLSQRRWDLSSLSFILNGGEAVIASTALRTMELLKPFGLPQTAMHPAWGMSETCSGTLFSDRFTRCTAEDPYVEVGSPVPELEVRIIDDSGNIVPEGVTGRLQVRGPMVTQGYYKNPEQDRESFSHDGWFNTGDLACMRDGQIGITGRAKDVIIVNGANFACHELEALAESVSGVAASFTAAVPVSTGKGNAEAFCVFFSPDENAQQSPARTAARIRSHLVRTAGVKPPFVLPVEKDVIPKTNIGKIARAELRRRFEQGEFAKLVSQMESESGHGDVLPSWFFAREWKARQLAGTDGVAPQTYLVFDDGSNFSALLASCLATAENVVVTVRRGPRFAQTGDRKFEIDPLSSIDYQRLATVLGRSGLHANTVVHAWTYGGRRPASSAGDIRARQYDGAYSLLFLTQALAAARLEPERLYVVSSNTQPVLPGDSFLPERSTVVGVVRTLALERDTVQVSHVDVSAADPGVSVASLLHEMGSRHPVPEAAWRNGIRFEPVLTRAEVASEIASPLPVVEGGMYLITGGLGGIGTEITRYLTEQCRIRALIIGTTELPPELEMDGIPATSETLASRIRNYRALKAAGVEFLYRAVNAADAEALKSAVAEAESLWKQPLAGIFHAAGNLGATGTVKRHWEQMDEHWVSNESIGTFERLFEPKVYGTLHLYQLLEERPGSLFVAFSSVNSLFGGATFSAYSAANRFLDTFCSSRRGNRNVSIFCVNWTMWNDTGMAAGGPAFGQQAARDMGYHVLNRTQGIQSLAAVLCRKPRHVIVGLDAASPPMRRLIRSEASNLETLQLKVSGATPPESVELKDRFGTPVRLTCSGEGAADSAAAGVVVEPRNDMEEALARIWCDVLDVQRTGVTESFFEIGGDSLLAVRLINRLRDVFDVHLSLSSLFEFPTIEALAVALAPGGELGVPHAEPGPESEVSALSDGEVDALLKKMASAAGGYLQ